jgi:hypothetical protein
MSLLQGRGPGVAQVRDVLIIWCALMLNYWLGFRAGRRAERRDLGSVKPRARRDREDS